MNQASFYSGQLTLSHPLESPPGALYPETTLLDAVASLSESGHRTGIVRDQHGSIAGVVSRQALERCLKQTGDDDEPNWRSRSLDMLSESRCLLRGPSATHVAEAPDNVECVPVFEDGRLVALMTKDDMLVS